jgi:hypothetical protein
MGTYAKPTPATTGSRATIFAIVNRVPRSNADVKIVKKGVEARTTWWNWIVSKGRCLAAEIRTGTVTSWREILETAMLMVYRTEKAQSIKFSLCVKRAGVCSSAGTKRKRCEETHK